MGFIDLSQFEPISPVPGCRMRTPFGQNLMLSYLEMDDGAEVPLHHHPHEQGGILLSGRVQLTIGDETRIVEAGSMFLIPPNVPHRAVAVDGPALSQAEPWARDTRPSGMASQPTGGGLGCRARAAQIASGTSIRTR